MLALPLLVTTLALAPTGDGARFEFSLGGDFQGTAVRMAPPIIGFSDGHTLGGTGGAGFTLFGQRVIDDDAPPTLQPYLQRVFQLHADGGAGGFRFRQDADAAAPGNDSTNGYADVNLSGYASWFYGYLGFGVRDRNDSPSGYSFLTLPVDAAAGVRFGDVRLSLGWTFAPTRVDTRPFSVPFWGGVYAHAYAVVRRQLSLSAAVNVLEGGAGASGGATVYLARRFGVGVSVGGSHQHASLPGYTFDGAGGTLSFEAWTSARVAVALGYSFNWLAYTYPMTPTENDYQSLISLSLRVRPH